MEIPTEIRNAPTKTELEARVKHYAEKHGVRKIKAELYKPWLDSAKSHWHLDADKFLREKKSRCAAALWNALNKTPKKSSKYNPKTTDGKPSVRTSKKQQKPKHKRSKQRQTVRSKTGKAKKRRQPDEGVGASRSRRKTSGVKETTRSKAECGSFTPYVDLIEHMIRM